MENNLKLTELRVQLSDKSIEERLEKLATFFHGRIIFTTSFGIEDQVITHIIFSNNLAIRIITLDTGRLFPETYEVYSNTLKRYNNKIISYFPDYMAIEKMVSEKGPFSFYDSKENREECCHIRKVAPLGRALEGMECWVTGIRSGQSENRSFMSDLEYDKNKKLYKFHPLFDWSFSDVEKYIKENQIPYNSLHDKGYLSIGCEPCTRAVKEGEDYRAGRWWWENNGQKECGCHIKQDAE